MKFVHIRAQEMEKLNKLLLKLKGPNLLVSTGGASLKKGALLGYMTALLSTSLLSSCGLVRDDLPPCPEDLKKVIELRFVYDYNMEFANAFHNQVDCLSVYFFDKNGELMWKETVSDPEVLADEDFRVYPELASGDYRVIAYGGMDCENSSFFQTGYFPEGTHYSNLHVQLDPTCLLNPEKYRLHNHYYGSLDFTVNPDENTKETVHMMRNTNSIQIALQNETQKEPIDHNDFIFEITDDNNDFDHDNTLTPTGEITYQPWSKENRSAVSDPDPSDPTITGSSFHAAVAHFTTSRLMIANPNTKPVATRLNVKRSLDNSVVLSVPLVNYMLMFKHDGSGAGLDKMDDQEYLDRENSWNFVFFLKDGMWLSSHIIINDWEVRMNIADL